MRQSRLYIDPAQHQLSIGGVIELTDQSMHYLKNVLRLRTDHLLKVFDGCGNEFDAVITAVEKKVVALKILKEVDHSVSQKSLDLTLAIGVSKGERMDWVMQKATELGVSRIQPLITERVEVKLGATRWQKKHQHWQHIAIAACEQSGRNTLPELSQVQPLNDFLSAAGSAQQKDELSIVLDFVDSSLVELEKRGQSPKQVTLLVGPEGGLSADELQQANELGFLSMNLGPRILRTETAPLAAISILQFLWGDMR